MSRPTPTRYYPFQDFLSFRPLQFASWLSIEQKKRIDLELTRSETSISVTYIHFSSPIRGTKLIETRYRCWNDICQPFFNLLVVQLNSLPLLFFFFFFLCAREKKKREEKKRNDRLTSWAVRCAISDRADRFDVAEIYNR